MSRIPSWPLGWLPFPLAPFFSQCGSGPTPTEIACRTWGVEVGTFRTFDDKEFAYVAARGIVRWSDTLPEPC